MVMQTQAAVRDAFLRFRERHDLDALGFVFDRTAQGLLLVASHLAASGVDPEDLVQATFMHAIRNAGAFEASRPLEPWLLGILTNEANNVRRRTARRVDVARRPPEPTSDPAESAAKRESVELLFASIATLPERLREVVTLHLVHGMTPTDIAHAIGRPVGSVKSWLHRSIAKLRQKVPSGLALAAVPLPDAKCLLAARQAVLAAGQHALAAAAPAALPAAAPTVATATAAGSLVATANMGRRLGLGGLCLLPLLAVALTLVVAAPPATVAPDAVGSPNQATTADRGHGLGAITDPLAREEPARTATTSELHVHVRWPDGSPAAVAGQLEPLHASDSLLRRRAFATDSSGNARIAGLPPGKFLVRLDRGVASPITLLPGPQSLRLDVPEGRVVSGTVLDEVGQPIAGATVWLTLAPSRDDGEAIASTAADGTFALREIPVGGALAAFADGFAPSRCVTVRAHDPHAPAPQHVELQFERRAAMCLVCVLDEHGAAVRGARVQVGGSDPADAPGQAADDCRPAPPWVGATDATGKVRCAQVPGTQRVAVFARAADHAGAAAWLRAGESTITLQLPAGGVVDGVVHGGAGTAGDAHVRLLPSIRPGDPALAPFWLLAGTRADAQGCWRLSGVATGSVVLEARRSEWFAQTRCFVTAARPQSWAAQLTRGGRVSGVARGADGTALASYRVELHAPGIVHRTEVGPDGLFAIEHLGELDHEVVLREPEAVADGVLWRGLGVRPGRVLDLVLPTAHLPTVAVVGRLLDANGQPMASLEISRPALADADREVACAADGTFVAEGLQPGLLSLLGGGYPYTLLRTFVARAGERVDLGTLQAAPRASCEVAIDPARERRNLQVALTDLASPTMVAVARWVGPGDSVWMPAPPGEYRLALTDGGVIVHQERVLLAAGTSTRIVVPPSPAGRGRWTLRLPNDTAWTSVAWRLEGEGIDWRGHCGPRRPGWVATPWIDLALPAGHYRLHAECNCGERATALVEVLAAAPSEPVPIELR